MPPDQQTQQTTQQTVDQTTQETTQQTQQSAPWFSTIDFGDAKDTAAATLSNYKTPADLLGALDWRKSVSGGDEKVLKALERYTAPQEFGKAHMEAVTKIRSGELAKPLPADATPEQVAEWRKGNGVPEKPEGYFEKLPNGLSIGADDKPLFDAVAAKLHARNVKPEVIHDLAEWFYGMQDDAVAKAKESDSRDQTTATDALRQEWGTDYRPNINLVTAHLDSMGKDLKPQFMDATLPDGTRLFNNVEFIKWMAGQAREINPVGHIVPSGTDGGIQSIQTEIASIEKTMQTNRKAYNADSAMQERLRQLYDARVKLQERGRAA